MKRYSIDQDFASTLHADPGGDFVTYDKAMAMIYAAYKCAYLDCIQDLRKVLNDGYNHKRAVHYPDWPKDLDFITHPHDKDIP